MIAALVLACALGAEGRLEAGVSAEGRWRRDTDGVQDPPTATDLALAPHARFVLRGARAAMDAAYDPRLALTDVGPHVRREVMHDGRLRLSVEPSAVWSLAATATGGAGRTDLITESQRPTLPAGAVPDVIATRQVLAVERAGLSLDLRTAPVRRAEILLSAGASVGGGADRAARAFLPTERSASPGDGKPPARIRFRYGALTRGEKPAATFRLRPGDAVVVE